MIKEYGYEYDATLNQELWKKYKGKVTYEKLWDALCLRSGRDALKTIAREYEPTTVFIPALACDSMITPFKMYGHKVVYYKLRNDYSIDYVHLSSIIDKGIFLYIDYFGIRTITDDNLERMKLTYPNLVFIEDRTHNLIWKRERHFCPDYIMASLRKWINIPDGGLLWPFRELKNLYFDEDITFSEERLKAQCMRNKYFGVGDENIKNEYRKIFSTVSEVLDRDKNPSRMSVYAYELANSTDWDEVRRRRKENAKCLIDILKMSNIHMIQENVGLSDLYVAFAINNRDFIQSKLSSKGIFNTIIWPLTERQKNFCKISKYTEEHMLAAPCDQRYSINDMLFIGNEIVRIINND